MWQLSKNNFVESKINTRLLRVLAILAICILLLGVNNTYIYNSSLMPFGVSVVFALLYMKCNGYILAIIYVVSRVYPWQLGGVVEAVVVSLVLALIEWLVNSGKIKLNKTKVLVCMLLAMLGFLVRGLGDSKLILATIIAIVLAVFFLYSCMCFFEATIGRGFAGGANLDEKVCGAALLIIFSIGMGNVYIGIVSIGLLFATIILLLVSRICNASIVLESSSLMGIGMAILNADPIYISLFVCMSVVAIGFKCSWRVLTGVAVLLSYVLFGLLFGIGLDLGSVFGVLIGVIVAVCIPSKLLLSISGLRQNIKQSMLDSVYVTSRKETAIRIGELSKIFARMDNVYRQMIKGKLSVEDTKDILKSELIATACDGCDNRDRCFRSSGVYMDNCFDSIVDIGYAKKRLTLVDLPEYLTVNCARVNEVVQVFNRLLESYNDYSESVNNLDTSRALIADQLGGVSVLLRSLESSLSEDVLVDNKSSELVKERLIYNNIACADCVVYSAVNDTKISLLVNNGGDDGEIIVNTVSKMFKHKYNIVSQEELAGGMRVVTLERADNYDIAFGCAVRTKSGKVVSGDTHSIVSIGGGRYMASICDGMGSGAGARDISLLTLDLIENFYQAGFDNEIILSSVNKLLSLNESENFSTIDLCVIDCKKNYYDFVKLGATNGYVVRANKDIEVISSSGLPVGVLENICPHITKLCISNMDIVVMVSDGVGDVLGDMSGYLRSIDIINPQTLANDIINLAIAKSQGESCDDMTVVCVRVLGNV